MASVESLVRPAAFEEFRTPISSPLLALIDDRHVVRLDPSMCVDHAADRSHPGPLSNSMFADAFWEGYERLYVAR